MASVRKSKAFTAPAAIEEREKAQTAAVTKRFVKKAQQCEVCRAVARSLIAATQPRLLQSVGGKDPYGRELERKQRGEAEAAATQTLVGLAL